MQLRTILALIAAIFVASAQAQGLPYTAPGDDVALQMNQAFRQGDRARLTQLLPLMRGHPLEPWAAYWELRARLDTAASLEVQAFLARWAGTYQEDRLRNDWLLLLGQRRDWQGFADEHPRFRMNDDTQVRCYALLVQQLREGATPELASEVRRLWLAQRDAEDACTTAARNLVGAPPGQPRITDQDVWRKARLAVTANRPRAAAAAVEMIEPQLLPLLTELQADPVRFLDRRAFAAKHRTKELVTLALLRLAATDPDRAAQALDAKWATMLSSEERDWLWGQLGQTSAQRLSSDAMGYYERAQRDANLTDDMLAWKARAALRAGPQWKVVGGAIAAMSEPLQAEPTWVYWRARSLMVSRSEEAQARAQEMLRAIASPRGFYEQLAMEELGSSIMPPAPPAIPSPEELADARKDPGLARALYAIALDLRSEGVREWNYVVALHRQGGMNDRELLAAAQLACEREIWDRCINTSERTREVFDMTQRFPTPFREAVMRRSREINLDPAYVYGLIRQESRFVTAARSSVGASGLMQVMPATARWTARRIGLTGFVPEQLSDRDTNIAIGTAYLKLALDDFGGSMPLAAAAYNAGPNRSRSWRNGPVLEAAIWAENVPFNETRDYVKKVLANTTLYASLLTGKPQSLKARLGTVGPRDPALPDPSRELP